MQWTLAPIVNALLNSNGWKKLLDPSVGQGTVGWPKQSVDQERYGIRYCDNGEILLDGIIYHKLSHETNVPLKFKGVPSEVVRKAEGIQFVSCFCFTVVSSVLMILTT